MNQEGFIRSFSINLEGVSEINEYPYSIPAIRNTQEVTLSPRVTFFVGENGTGKSTIIEALAINAGFNPEGGSKNFAFATNSTESNLYKVLSLIRNAYREKTGYFLRAESFYNLATNIDELDEDPSAGPRIIESHGGKSLHHQSHGESFMALVNYRFGANGLYILDEPEAALSPSRQLALLVRMHELTQQGCQFIIATHSPILLGYPTAVIYSMNKEGIQIINYEETEHYQITKDYLNHTDVYRKKLFEA